MLKIESNGELRRINSTNQYALWFDIREWDNLTSIVYIFSHLFIIKNFEQIENAAEFGNRTIGEFTEKLKQRYEEENLTIFAHPRYRVVFQNDLSSISVDNRVGFSWDASEDAKTKSYYFSDLDNFTHF